MFLLYFYLALKKFSTRLGFLCMEKFFICAGFVKGKICFRVQTPKLVLFGSTNKTRILELYKTFKNSAGAQKKPIHLARTIVPGKSSLKFMLFSTFDSVICRNIFVLKNFDLSIVNLLKANNQITSNINPLMANVRLMVEFRKFDSLFILENWGHWWLK